MLMYQKTMFDSYYCIKSFCHLKISKSSFSVYCWCHHFFVTALNAYLCKVESRASTTRDTWGCVGQNMAVKSMRRGLLCNTCNNGLQI